MHKMFLNVYFTLVCLHTNKYLGVLFPSLYTGNSWTPHHYCITLHQLAKNEFFSKSVASASCIVHHFRFLQYFRFHHASQRNTFGAAGKQKGKYRDRISKLGNNSAAHEKNIPSRHKSSGREAWPGCSGPGVGGEKLKQNLNESKKFLLGEVRLN